MSVLQLIGKALLLLVGLVLLLGGGLCTFTNGYLVIENLIHSGKSPTLNDYNFIPLILGLLVLSLLAVWSGWKLLVWVKRSRRRTEQ